MRLTIEAEREFRAQLVANTKRLVRDSKASLAQKLALIQQAVKENAARIAALRSAREKVEDEEKVHYIDTLIAVRLKGEAYLTSTAKWLTDTAKDPWTLRERPSPFAAPNWQRP